MFILRRTKLGRMENTDRKAAEHLLFMYSGTLKEKLDLRKRKYFTCKSLNVLLVNPLV